MRQLRSFLLLLPILLLALVLLAWARSYLPDQTFFRSHQGRLLIIFATGDYSKFLDQGTEQAIDYCRRVAQVQSLPILRLAGFEWTDLNFKSSYPGFVAIPYWSLATPLAALSLWAMARRRAHRERNLPGHCRDCGYDLRGSNGRCPECGRECQSPPQTTPAAAIG